MNPQPKDKWKEVDKENLIPVAQYRQNYLSKTKKKNKFNAKKQQYNGIKYDSQLESKVAENYDFMLKSGDLIDVRRQVKIPLHVNNVLVCNYYIDFVVTDKNNQRIYAEVKGFETQLWQLKWKLFVALLPMIDPDGICEIIKR